MPKRTAKGFAAQVNDAFLAASADRDKIKTFKELARKHPAEAAEVVCKAIPRLMHRVRTQADESHGVDIAREGWKEEFKQRRHNDAEAGLLLMAANYYLLYSWCQTKLDAYAADKSLSKEEWATKVCEVGIEALRGTEQVLLHNLQEELGRVTGEAESFVKDMLALRLAGALATRISLKTDKRLAKALDDIRGRDEPARQGRLETLLSELFTLAPTSFADHHVVDWQLKATRSAVGKSIVETIDTKNEADWREKGQSVGAPVEGLEEDSVDVDPLESFIAKEAAQHAVKLGALMEQAKLSPQQRKIVVLLINEEGLLYPNGDIAAEEVGARLGIPANQTSVQWRRAREKMVTASGE